MRSQWVPDATMEHILAALTPENRLACEVSLATGLRIGDVLSLKPDQVRRQRFTIKEQKTGKPRRVYLPLSIVEALLRQAGRFWVFEGRTDPKKHRTRQAVFKDLRRAAVLFRCRPNVSPHSLRKMYAVNYYHKSGSLAKVQKLLNHSSEAVTVLYAMADCVTVGRRGRNKSRLDKGGDSR